MRKSLEYISDVNDAVLNFLIPGKKQYDESIIDSEFNQRHKLVGYNPFEYLATPFDVTPLGAAVKMQKGYKAIRGGQKLVRLGISGFGKRLKQKGFIDIGSVIATKGYQYLSGRAPPSKVKAQFGVTKPIRSEQSRVGSSLTSKPKTRGKKRSKFYMDKVYYPKKGAKCKTGYRYDKRSGLCVANDHWDVRYLFDNPMKG